MSYVPEPGPRDDQPALRVEGRPLMSYVPEPGPRDEQRALPIGERFALRRSPNTPGHNKPLARQGYYTRAESEDDARAKIRERLAKEGMPGINEERLDVQVWE
jgi:hypothetical protein